MKKFFTVLVTLFVIGIIVFLFVLSIDADSVDAYDLLKIFSSIIGIISVSLGVYRKHKNNSLSTYENKYSEYLQGAFETNKSLKKELLRAIRDYENNDNQKAIKNLAALFKKTDYHKEREVILFFMALCMEECGNHNDAISYYKHLLEINPFNSTALSNLTVLYRKIGNYDEALKCGKRAIDFDIKNANAYHNVASIYFHKYEFKEAKEYAHKALDVQANLKVAASLLAIVYSLEKNFPQAQKYTHIAVTSGEDPEKLKAAIEKYQVSYSMLINIKNNVQRWTDHTGEPAISFTLDGTDSKSIIGGKINVNAPIGSDGRPLRLLAAIFCSELPPNTAFPPKGVIRFYIANDDLYGADFDMPTLQKNFRVLYDPDEYKFITGEYGGNDDEFAVCGSHRVKFNYISKDPLTFCDYRFDDNFESAVSNGIVTPECRDDDDFMEAIGSDASKLGGYPMFTQYDPRENKEELQKYDVLLFQLSSDYSGKVIFGDGGICNFFIPREKLKQLDFTDVLYNWDCY